MNTPKVSVCMPMLNASRYLRECIDSVLAQTFADFEFLIADDGSTDKSVEIVESYSDPRIRLIRRHHDYIATLNCLLSEARGEYIARMDADDVMLPQRLQVQFDYMESHPDIAVLGGNMIILENGKERKDTTYGGEITMLHMIECCAIAHPTVMFRGEIMRQYKFRYNANYIYAEDYALWVTILKAKCRIVVIPDDVIKYRVSPAQNSCKYSTQQSRASELVRVEACRWLIEQSQIPMAADAEKVVKSCNELTVVIPFLNENKEVVNTVKSIRDTAGQNVDIVVINDNSSDDYDYDLQLRKYNVRYYKNEIRLGAALSKEKGIQLSCTKYFLVLDAHMRLLTDNWLSLLLEALRDNPDRLLCCKTVPIQVANNEQIIIDDKYKECRGAYLTFHNDELIPGIQWLENISEPILGLPKTQICAVLGACYASSKTYWSEITGMHGLLHFGCEEACISLKAWLNGGGCSYLPDIVLGHIYKQSAPYHISYPMYMYNYLAIADMLFPTSDRCRAHAVAMLYNKEHYQIACTLLMANHHSLSTNRAKYKARVKANFERIIDMNMHAAAIQHKILPELQPIMANITQAVINDISNRAQSYGFIDGGLCGKLLYILSYIKSCAITDELVLDAACDYFAKVSSCVKIGAVSFDFTSGLSGIGWALLYAQQHQLMNDDVEPLLQKIDTSLSLFSPKRVAHNTSFLDGIGGVYCYVVNRIKTSHMQSCLDNSFLEELKEVATMVLESTKDLRTITYVLQFMASSKVDDFAFKVMRPIDVVIPNRFIPKDTKLWKLDYQNILGYAFICLYIKQLNDEKKYL